MILEAVGLVVVIGLIAIGLVVVTRRFVDRRP